LDITSDGKTVCGLVIGRDPPRVQPAVWQERDGDWVCETLSIDVLYNPFLVASRVAISDDGDRVVATVITTSDNDSKNRLCQWKRQADGSWSRRVLSDHAVHVADVNNHGMVAGRITHRGRRQGYIFDPDRGAQILEPFPGDHNVEATAVNNSGVVVGISDDPPGPDGGTTAFVWQQGIMKRIEFPGEAIFSSARAILDNGQVGGWLLRRSPDDPNQVENGSFLLQLDLTTHEAAAPVR
jgi:probable HAF family extracellular repeat protein